MMEKPDYVANFIRPANTEIKFIRGHWYLYERSNVYDPQLGRSRKKSGKILGSITEHGLVPSKARREYTTPVLNDVVEVGAANYIYPRTVSYTHLGLRWKKEALSLRAVSGS